MVLLSLLLMPGPLRRLHIHHVSCPLTLHPSVLIFPALEVEPATFENLQTHPTKLPRLALNFQSPISAS